MWYGTKSCTYHIRCTKLAKAKLIRKLERQSALLPSVSAQRIILKNAILIIIIIIIVIIIITIIFSIINYYDDSQT